MQTLKYSLIESKLKNAPDAYLAKPQLEQSCTLDQIVSNMLNRGTSLTQTDIEAVIDLFFTECETQIANGRPLNLPFLNGMPVVRGTFSDPNDSFDPNRHSIEYKLSPGTRIKKAVHKIKTEKVAYNEPMPVISQFMDVNSHSINSLITSKGIGEISGAKLQIDTTDSKQGIFFIHSSGTANKVTIIAKNRPSKLIFQIPELEAGTYHIEIRTQFQNSGILRSSQLRKKLAVTASV